MYLEIERVSGMSGGIGMVLALVIMGAAAAALVTGAVLVIKKYRIDKYRYWDDPDSKDA